MAGAGRRAPARRAAAAGETIVLGPGDRIDIPERTPHRAQVLGLTPVIYLTGAPPDAFPRPARAAVSAA